MRAQHDPFALIILVESASTSVPGPRRERDLLGVGVECALPREKRHVADSRAGSHNPQQIRAAFRDDKVREGYFGSFHSEYSNLEEKEGRMHSGSDEHGPRVAAPPDADSGARGDLVSGLGRDRGDDEWRIWVLVLGPPGRLALRVRPRGQDLPNGGTHPRGAPQPARRVDHRRPGRRERQARLLPER